VKRVEMEKNRRHILQIEIKVDKPVNDNRIEDKHAFLKIIRFLSFSILIFSLVILAIVYDPFIHPQGIPGFNLPIWFYAIPIITCIIFAATMWSLKRKSKERL